MRNKTWYKKWRGEYFIKIFFCGMIFGIVLSGIIMIFILSSNSKSIVNDSKNSTDVFEEIKIFCNKYPNSYPCSQTDRIISDKEYYNNSVPRSFVLQTFKAGFKEGCLRMATLFNQEQENIIRFENVSIDIKLLKECLNQSNNFYEAYYNE